MINKIKKIILHPSLILYYLDWYKIIKLPDKYYLKLKYFVELNRWPNFDNPTRYTEKLQLLKLYDRKEKYTELVDKYMFKKIITKKIGKEHVIPLIGVYDKFDEIDFSKLPNSFVIKCNHDSGGFIICRNKKDFNISKARKKINKCLRRNFYYQSREWPYKNIKRKIIVEKYMTDHSSDALTDYKFFCFNGEPKIMYISHDDSATPTTDFFDMDFNKIDLHFRDQNSIQPPQKPLFFEEMKEYSRILSKNIPNVRVDFYIINNQVYVGEITFYHLGGMFEFHPDKYDEIFGSYIDNKYIGM